MTKCVFPCTQVPMVKPSVKSTLIKCSSFLNCLGCTENETGSLHPSVCHFHVLPVATFMGSHHTPSRPHCCKSFLVAWSHFFAIFRSSGAGCRNLISYISIQSWRRGEQRGCQPVPLLWEGNTKKERGVCWLLPLTSNFYRACFERKIENFGDLEIESYRDILQGSTYRPYLHIVGDHLCFAQAKMFWASKYLSRFKIGNLTPIG